MLRTSKRIFLAGHRLTRGNHGLIYSKVLPGPEKIRISSKLENDQLLRAENMEEKTVYELFLKGLQHSKSGRCLGTRNKKTGKYEWLSYLETMQLALSVGAGFRQIGIEHGGLIGINCKNRLEFVLTYLAGSAYSNVTVPLYDHLSSEAVNHIIKTTEAPLFIVDSDEKADYILSQRSHFPKLRTLAVTHTPSRDLLSKGKSCDLQIMSFTDIELLGRFKSKNFVPPKPEDLFTICWTSGSTGMPKGAPITHGNLACSVLSAINAVKPYSLSNNSTISYMPTGHIYEILVEVQTLTSGGAMGFFSGDVTKIMDDVATLKPKSMPIVPRILNRLYQVCLKEINDHPVKRRLLPIALRQKEKQIQSGDLSKNTIWDKILFRKTQDQFGGNVDLLVSSAAPLSPEVHRFIQCALGVRVLNGYGQTETGAITISHLTDTSGDNVGAPAPGMMVKLIDVPEMGYLSKNDIGEICAKGDGIIKAYFKNPSADKDTFDAEGWIHTGDVGAWLPNGNLRLVDRKKNLFKLSQGEYISPEKVENVYIRLPLLQQVYVDGREDKDYVIAIVVPEPTAFLSWVKHKGLNNNNSDLKSLCNNKEIRKNVMRKLRNLGKESGLSSLEQIRNVHLRPDAFTIEEGFLTPTLKLKRNVIKKEFIAIVDQLYQEEPFSDNQ